MTVLPSGNFPTLPLGISFMSFGDKASNSLLAALLSPVSATTLLPLECMLAMMVLPLSEMLIRKL
jgi:hypothetical protein